MCDRRCAVLPFGVSVMKNSAKTGQRTEVSLVNDRSGEQDGRRGSQRQDM